MLLLRVRRLGSGDGVSGRKSPTLRLLRALMLVQVSNLPVLFFKTRESKSFAQLSMLTRLCHHLLMVICRLLA